MRRHATARILVSLSMVGCAALAACSSSGSSSASAGGGHSASTTKIGVVLPLSGSTGSLGQEVRNGLELAVKQANAAGSNIQLVVKDDQGKPPNDVQAVRGLAGEGVNLIAGGLTTPSCNAITPLLSSLNMINITPTCVDDSQTGVFGTATPNFYGISGRATMATKALAIVIAKKYPNITQYSDFSPDYSATIQYWTDYRDALKAQGLSFTVPNQIYVPLSQTDYTSQLSVLNQSLTGSTATRALHLTTFGALTALFIKQAAPLQLLSKFALLTVTGEYYKVAATLNGTAPEAWNPYDYNYQAFDTEANKTFVTQFEADYHTTPSDQAYQGYLTGLFYAAAVKKAGSSSTSAVAAALNGLTITGPSGQVTMSGATHEPNIPMVVTHSVGDPSARDGVKILGTTVVPATDAGFKG